MDEKMLNVSDDLMQSPVLSKVVDAKIRETLPEGVYDHYFGSKKSKLPQSNKQRLAFALNLWRNNGWENRHTDPAKYDREEREEKRVKVKDLINSLNTSAQVAGKKIKDLAAAGELALTDAEQPTDATILLPQVVTTIIREAVEPELTLTSLFRRMQFSAGEQITFPAAGGFTAEDMAENDEYPERQMEFAGKVTAKIGKVGVAVKFSDAMLRYSMFDVMSMHLQAAGRAMARHKEQKVANIITTEGTTVYDNSGGTSVNGFTTGRDATGTPNGSLVLQDLFQGFAQLMNAGFVPNTLLMNPMGWLVFMQNDTLRMMGIMHNGPLWGPVNGMPAQAPTFGPMYGSGGNTPSATPAEMANSNLMSPIPSMFPAPMNIVVSPFIPYTASTQVTNIVMCDRTELGILVEDEPLVTESWDDPARDMTKTKMRERYALAIDNGGLAVAQFKDIKIARGYDWDNFVVEATRPATGLPVPTGGFC